MGDKVEQVRPFPVRMITVAMIAMTLLVSAMSWFTWHVNSRIREIAFSQAEVQTLAQELRREGDVLQLLAHLVVRTGDESYARRYREMQPKVPQRIEQLGRAIRLKANSTTLRQIAAADQELTRMEYEAIAKAMSGRLRDATAVLNARRYADLAQRYETGTLQIQRRSRAFLAGSHRDLDGYLVAKIASTLAMFVLVILTWLFIVRPARKWGSALEEMRARAESATRAKSAFLATISHEIRTPLNSIIGFTELLLTDQQLNDQQQHQIRLVKNAGTSLLTVVNDVLDVSKIEAGKVELAPDRFALDCLVGNSLSIVRGSADAKGLEMQLSMDPQLSKFYVGDEGRLRQILLNLLNNAVKFTDAGSVSLDVRKDFDESGADLVRFRVIDTGIGLDAEQQQQLFVPFSQADATVTRRFGGTGLGLSISKRLLEMMGGQIAVKSAPGKGSCFWFTVPLVRCERPILEQEKGPAPAPIRPARILLAEDLPMNQELACAILNRAGHQVEIANDGEEALKAAGENAYDLVLMDIQMPRMDGVTATRLIRQLPGRAGKVPILAMTANVLAEQVAEFMAAGMNGLVPKPIEQRALRAAISAVLAKQEGAAEEKIRDAEDPDIAIFDEATFRNIREMLTPERLQLHVQALDKQVQELAATACGVGDGAAASGGAAHKIVSQSGMLGLRRLSHAARALEEACRSGTNIDRALAGFRAAANDLQDRLGSLLKEDRGDELAA